jgi:DNA-binding transcriptional LysR family regulator
MDKLRAMRVFACVAREGSLVSSARALDVTPAAVSRQLADLEAQLGAHLINRTTRHLALTKIGERYLQSVQHILHDLDATETLLRDEIDLPQGPLRVQVASAFAFHQLVGHLGEFRAEFPKVALELSVSPAVTMLNDHFDVCVLLVDGELSDNSMVARQLACSEIVSCASAGYLDRRGRPTHPSELERHDLVVLHNLRREVHFHRIASGGASLTGECVTITLPAAALDSNDIELNYRAALEGLGIAGLPSFMVAQALRAGRLERVLPEWHLRRLRLYAAVPTRRHLPARTQVFIEFLRDRYGGDTDSDPWLDAAAVLAQGARH